VAVGAVWLTSLFPALVLGPLAGAVADRFDRRTNMIVGDVVRAVLYLTIPIDLSVGVVNKLVWMYTVQFLASCASLFWTPAKDATVPNLVPPERLEQANQLSLLGTYGTAPIAGLVFSLLALVSRLLGSISPYFKTDQVRLSLYFNVVTFVVSALTVFTLREISRRRVQISAPSVAKTIVAGWRYIGQSQVVRGIVTGMVGAFAAAGVVVGLGQVTSPTPWTAERPAGAWCSPRSSSGWPLACSWACGSCAGSAGAACSACRSRSRRSRWH
jgi:dTMP kinase